MKSSFNFHFEFENNFLKVNHTLADWETLEEWEVMAIPQFEFKDANIFLECTQ